MYRWWPDRVRYNNMYCTKLQEHFLYSLNSKLNIVSLTETFISGPFDFLSNHCPFILKRNCAFSHYFFARILGGDVQDWEPLWGVAEAEHPPAWAGPDDEQQDGWQFTTGCQWESHEHLPDWGGQISRPGPWDSQVISGDLQIKSIILCKYNNYCPPCSSLFLISLFLLHHRFVRREKEIAESRFEVAQGESLRYRLRVEHLERELKEVQDSLSAAKERMQVCF